ncbi:MAG: hypothetical protein LBU43_09185 [Candidatus Accumulibacter sp.]|jgi:hypothetical protein|nr:hypothetical protein [Accumulibacter sp.]
MNARVRGEADAANNSRAPAARIVESLIMGGVSPGRAAGKVDQFTG